MVPYSVRLSAVYQQPNHMDDPTRAKQLSGYLLKPNATAFSGIGDISFTLLSAMLLFYALMLELRHKDRALKMICYCCRAFSYRWNLAE